jgi:CelD/BcsL family acetyltransferase involved in cellulose biosynthesis
MNHAILADAADHSAKHPKLSELALLARQEPDLVAKWCKLAERAPSSLVEMHPQIVLLGAGADTNSPRGLLLHASDQAGELTSLAVLMEKDVALPLLPGLAWRPSLRGLRLVGSRLLQTDSDVELADFAASFQQLLSGPGARYACLLLEDVPVDSPWWEIFRSNRRLRRIEHVAPQPRWFLRFPGSAEAYWKGFSSKTRYNFRRQKRLFDHQWQAVTKPAQVASFLSDATAVSSRSWQGKRLGLRVRSDFDRLLFFSRLAELGALRCYLLRSQGEPVAFAIGTQWHGRFILEEIGYDTRYANYSPGTVLWLNILEDMFQRNTPELVDFGFGDGAYKQLFGNQSSQSGTLLVVSRRFGPSLKMGLSRMAAWTGGAARSTLRRSGLADWFRRRYRR